MTGNLIKSRHEQHTGWRPILPIRIQTQTLCIKPGPQVGRGLDGTTNLIFK